MSRRPRLRSQSPIRSPRGRSSSVGLRSDSDASVEKLYADKPIPYVIRPTSNSGLSVLKAYLARNREQLVDLLYQSGALLFRGWQVTDAQDFEDCAHILEPDLKNAYLGTSPRRSVTEYTFTASELPRIFPIPQHLEMSFLKKSRPGKLFFCCLQPPLSGGETPITDMAAVYRDMDPEVRQRFEDKDVLYYRNYTSPTERQLDPWKLKRWTEIFETTDKEKVQSVCAMDEVNVEWRKNDSLQLTNTTSAVTVHPLTGRKTWCNHAAVFHVSMVWGEYQRIAKHTRKLSHWLLAWILFFVIWLKRLFQKETDQGMNALYGDGTLISDKDMEAVRTAVWKNTVFYAWEKGDFTMVDNSAVSHGRMPFTGPRMVIVAWGGEQGKR
eukprot:TRINITY_DN4764_c0_g1_i2.p2 TRINITY_DN4764_c0_g1~~TRINITY_DN4764_c0_g1_i2.p2  ORF type:complete len:382 (-),score=52.06 TRINITY_DN4764_c0_g1_i2:472-1617(-)